jgi:hypothetical protein
MMSFAVNPKGTDIELSFNFWDPISEEIIDATAAEKAKGTRLLEQA